LKYSNDNEQKCNIAIFASGTGSNFINIYNHILDGKIFANINILISNNPNCKAIEFAKKNKINYKIINKFRLSNNENIEKVIGKVLIKNNINLIVLAGYMKKIPKQIIELYPRKILNIHPALLPKFGGKGFYGIKVHEAVINSGEKSTGITIHFVDNDYDTGDIIYQKEVDVLENDSAVSLSKRVLELEHKSYPVVVKEFCDKYRKELN